MRGFLLTKAYTPYTLWSSIDKNRGDVMYLILEILFSVPVANDEV